MNNLNNINKNKPSVQSIIPAKVDGKTACINLTPLNRAKELLNLQEALSNGTNFEAINQLALDYVEDILDHWLPDGNYKGRQYVVVNPTRNDGNPGSFTINTERGVWSDFSTGDKGGDLISLIAYAEGGITQTSAATKILHFLIELENKANTQGVGHRTGQTPSKTKFTPIMPIPDDASARPEFFGSSLGRPSASWEYRNQNGEIMFYVNRFKTEKGKSFLPLTYCRDSGGHFLWKSLAPTTPRPAYGLDRLAERPEVPVIFAEGEKAADAAQRLFPEFVAVTTMGGAQSPEKTDFAPFSGRKVYIAPDNDEAGMAYTSKLIQLLTDIGAVVVAVMRLDMFAKENSLLSAGYDLADAEAEGWTAESLAQIGSNLWAQVKTSIQVPTSALKKQADIEAKAHSTKPGNVKPLEFAILFAKHNFDGNLAYCDNQILAYVGGYWKPLNEDVEVKKPVLLAIGKEATAGKVKSILDLIKIQYAETAETFERRTSLICLNNGTLDPVSGVLLQHSVKHYLTNRLDIAYDVQARCPIWLQTLEEIFAPDQDKVEKIQLIQEFIGYCLIPDTRFHKFLWLVGSGGNGKSLILSVITALIGRVNISYAQMERLQEKFVRAELQGKLVNISSEMSAQATVSDGYLKQITAGDMIEAERKHERPFSFKPYSRLIGATNVLPRLLDHSDGFFRRAMILRFNRQFTEAEQDNQREAKLLAELPGILNWAVTGLQNLLQRKNFIMPQSSKLEVSQYRLNSDPVRQFREEFLEVTEDKDAWLQSATLYDSYKDWSVSNGYKTLASNQFAERLLAVGIEKERRSNGRFWKARYITSNTLSFIVESRISPSAAKYDV